MSDRQLVTVTLASGLTIQTSAEVAKRLRLENRILGTLCARLKKAGWSPSAIYIGDEGWEKTPTVKAVRVLFDDLDDIDLSFKNAAGRRHVVKLIRGNGIDLICDWTMARESAPDNFSDTM